MAYPASAVRLAVALEQIDQTLVQVRDLAVSVRQQAAAGPLSADVLQLGLLPRLNALVELLDGYQGLPGLGAYIAQEKGAVVADPVAELVAARGAAAALRSWIIGAFPRHGDHVLLHRWDAATGQKTARTFSVAETAEMRTRIDTFTGTIS